MKVRRRAAVAVLAAGWFQSSDGGKCVMQRPITERIIILYLRVAMAWTFLYPAFRQTLSPDFSVAGFLGHTKTFHDLFSIFAPPPVAHVMSALVAYGHLLIGLSLLVGLLVRLSAGFGALLMIAYWMAHMDWPYIEDKTNFVIDQHLVYAGILLYLGIVRAGQYWGLDAWIQSRRLPNKLASAAFVSEAPVIQSSPSST
jgi:thiosulfate dehydrogenase [quinone] large subunit